MNAPSPFDRAASPGLSRFTRSALALALVVAALAVGLPGINAPWLQGDEAIFIVNNPAVTGRGTVATFPERVAEIFAYPPEEDLYQPIPILTYASQWAVFGNAPAAFRFLDVLLHAGCALLLWLVAQRLLRAALRDESPAVILIAAWCAALLWTLHPMLGRAYAADMGRTHVLAALFALLSLYLHFTGLQTRRSWRFWAAWLALVAAMLSKVLPGWVLLIAVLEGMTVGWRRMLVSPRIYIIAATCAVFATSAYYTSQTSGLLEDASAGLFGDPLARASLAVWIYTRNLVAPLWISPWYLPDPQTNWQNPLVWCGLLLALASFAHAGWAMVRQRLAIVVGWAWCWGTLLPTIGLVGARELAADDRYFYQPLMGVLLVSTAVVVRPLMRAAERKRRAAWVGLTTVGVIALLLFSTSLPYVKMFRSVVASRERIVALNPGDPRALEALAQGYDYASDHPLPPDEQRRVPEGTPQLLFFRQAAIDALHAAAAVDDIAAYFPSEEDLAPFYRRLSFAFWRTMQFEDSLELAERAAALQPENYLTWLRVAHAQQGRGHYEAAAAAYARAEQFLPDAPSARATHYTNYGAVLLFHLNRAEAAYPKFKAALETGAAGTIARIGLALCEIRVGQGATGRDLILEVLDQNPQNPLAGLVLAEYHLKSHHWEQAAQVYEQLIAAFPAVYDRFDWYYQALRGRHTVHMQRGEYQAAVALWDDAVSRYPGRRELRSFLVWSAACAGLPDAGRWADALREADPDNPFAYLSQVLIATRANEIPAALDWVGRARDAGDLPDARPFERALSMLRLLRSRGELPAAARLVEGQLLILQGASDRGQVLFERYLQAAPEGDWVDLARRLLRAAQPQNQVGEASAEP